MEVSPAIPAASASASAQTNKKVATHSHIRGLGLKEDGAAEPISAGFVGQLKAREVRSSAFLIHFISFLFRLLA